MSLKKVFVTIRDNYVIRQSNGFSLPEFAPSEDKRYRYVFSGRVQHVGFRLEAAMLAERLGLTGFCENQPDGSVLAEFQGPEAKTEFLVKTMSSLIRIKIRKMTAEELPLREGETAFVSR